MHQIPYFVSFVLFVVSHIEEVLRAFRPAPLVIDSPGESLHAGRDIVTEALIWSKAKRRVRMG
jgi:hypothetical protein